MYQNFIFLLGHLLFFLLFFFTFMENFFLRQSSSNAFLTKFEQNATGVLRVYETMAMLLVMMNCCGHGDGHRYHRHGHHGNENGYGNGDDS